MNKQKETIWTEIKLGKIMVERDPPKGVKGGSKKG